MYSFISNRNRSIINVLIFVTIVLGITNYISSGFDMYPFAQQQLGRVSDVYDRPTRIFCFVLTSPGNVRTRARAVNQTWGPRCDGFFFVSDLPTINMKPNEIIMMNSLPLAPIRNITPGYDHLTQKVTNTFLYIYEHLRNNYDWFVKADDDTYLIVEHLKMFLSEQNTSEPVTFGCNLQMHVPKGYHSGGASYVLSSEALKRFYQGHNESNKNCSKDGGDEDVEIARCLRAKNVHPGRSVDEFNRDLFHPLSFQDHFRGRFPEWLLARAENPLGSHLNCCSYRSISFHYVDPVNQYMIDFMRYKAQSSSNRSIITSRKRKRSFSV